jgi:hypothetical protein
MNSEKVLAQFAQSFLQAIDARQDYGAALTNLQRDAKACSQVCQEFTQRLNQEHPELVWEIKEAYRHGERIKDAMQRGKRWPEYDSAKGTTYLAILSGVPSEQRSPELEECLSWWQKFEDARQKIEALYPPPDHFRWNGSELVGPNLYPDFKLFTE